MEPAARDGRPDVGIDDWAPTPGQPETICFHLFVYSIMYPYLRSVPRPRGPGPHMLLWVGGLCVRCQRQLCVIRIRWGWDGENVVGAIGVFRRNGRPGQRFV